MTQETDIETITGVEIEVETEVEIEAGIEEIAEIIVETEEDQIQEKVETTNRDLVQVKDTLTKRISVTTAIEQVITTHRCFKLENYLKRQGKRIVLHDDDDVQEIAQAVQDLNTKLNSLKFSNSTKKLKNSLCIKGNPKLCPKPCPSVSFCLNPIEIPCSSHKDVEEDGILSCEEQTQPVKSLGTSEVESENLSESDIDPFETMCGEMDEDSFHQMMEGNDWTYSPLFSDKEFLNEDWHKYTCIESCAAIGNARHGCKSLGTDIQSIREIDDSGSTLLSEIGNMMTNITGSSILKSTGHTSQVKPGKIVS